MRWSLAQEYRCHPAYALALKDAINAVRVHALATLDFDMAGKGDAVAIDGELRALLAEYDRRTNRASA